MLFTSKRGCKAKRQAAASKSARPLVTPLTPPVVLPGQQQAADRERLFLRRFERNFSKLDRISHPIRRKSYAVRSAQTLFFNDPYRDIVSRLQAAGITDPSIIDQYPHDRSIHASFPRKGLFSRRAQLVVCALSLSPVGDSKDLLGRRQLLAAIEEKRVSSKAFHVFGVLSTSGWEPGLLEQVPQGEDYALVLVEQLSSGGWRIGDSLSKRGLSLRMLFDPEELEEKIHRTAERLRSTPNLQIPGGMVEIDPLLESMGIDLPTLKSALEWVRRDDNRIAIANVAGQLILKRDRY